MTERSGPTRRPDPWVVGTVALAVLVVVTAILCWLVLRQPTLPPLPVPSVSLG